MENKIDFWKPAIQCLLIGLFFASLSQSCGTTKASIGRMITDNIYPDKLSLKPVFKPLEDRYFFYGTLDTPKKDKPFKAVIQDTTNYNRMILDNQQLSLLNEKKILELLMNKERENKKLKAVNGVLAKNSQVSDEVKADAKSMNVIWATGDKILTLCAVILGMIIIQNVVLFLLLRKRNRC